MYARPRDENVHRRRQKATKVSRPAKMAGKIASSAAVIEANEQAAIHFMQVRLKPDPHVTDPHVTEPRVTGPHVN